MSGQREHWESRLGFVLAAAGSAIGLGSLWKFPYVTGQNGGGAFVLIYLGATFFVCFPLFIAELVMGRATQRGAVGAYGRLAGERRGWRGVGWLAMFSTLIVFSYYAVVAGWTLNYVFMSLLQFYRNRSPEEIADVFNILVASPDICLLWQVVFLLITGAVVFTGVRKGVEHWARILTPALLIFLFALFIYAMTLPGFGQAARFLLTPDFSRLSPSGILEALGLSFFTASLGFGVIVTYGSYLRPRDDLPQTSLIVLVMTVVISVIAALTIFPIIFSFGLEPDQGAGLVFKTLPVLFAQLPGALVLSTVFFMLLVFTALTSTISLLENMVANVMELFNWSRHKAVSLSLLLVFLVGVPSAVAGSGVLFPAWAPMYGGDYFTTVSGVWDRWFLPITGLLTSLFVGWFVSGHVRNREFLMGTSWRLLFRPWVFLLRWVVPLLILLFILEATGIINVDRWFT